MTPASISYYPSPKFTIDPSADRVIIEFRNEATGDVTQQYPAKDVVRQYAQAAPKPETSSAKPASA